MLPPYTPSCSKITSQEYNYRNTTFLLVIAEHTELQPGGAWSTSQIPMDFKFQLHVDFAHL